MKVGSLMKRGGGGDELQVGEWFFFTFFLFWMSCVLIGETYNFD